MRNFKIKTPSEKSFGIFFSIVFFIFSIYPFFYGNSIRNYLLIISIVLIIITFTKTKLLILPNKLWMKIGSILGLIVSPVIIFLIYITTFCSIGLILKLIGKDLLSIRFDKSKKSYWHLVNNKNSSMRDQF